MRIYSAKCNKNGKMSLCTNIILISLHAAFFSSCGKKSSKPAAAPSPDANTPAIQEIDSKDTESTTVVDLKDIIGQIPVDFEAGEVRQITDVPELASQSTSIRPELMTAFCIHAYKLPLKENFDTELGILCGTNKKPTEMFTLIDRYTKIDPKKPKALEISNSEAAGFNKSIVITGISVPIPPKFVKEAHIQDYMTAPANFPYFKQESRVQKDLTSEVGGDLTFGRYELYYKTQNKTQDGKSFSNERTSQFNGYQVQGGNSDIGLGAEHMISKTSDYKYFKTITVTIGNVDGGSTIITIANVEVNHNGYPKDARRLAVDTATAQSVHVLEGVLLEKKDRIISK